MFLDVLFPSTSDVTSAHKLRMFLEAWGDCSRAMHIALDKVDALLRTGGVGGVTVSRAGNKYS